MSILLKKVKGLEEKARHLVEKWEAMKAENDRLHEINAELTERMERLKAEFEHIKGKKELEADASANESRYREEIAACRRDLEESIELLRNYKHGI